MVDAAVDFVPFAFGGDAENFCYAEVVDETVDPFRADEFVLREDCFDTREIFQREESFDPFFVGKVGPAQAG